MVDIAQLGHEDDFELQTNELGVLICWNPNPDKLEEVLEGHPTNSVDEQSRFMRAVLLATAHRPHSGKPWQANPIASEDVERVTTKELGTFALKQAERVYARLKQPQEHTDNPYLSLASALIHARAIRRDSLEKIRKQFSHAFTRDSTIGAILKNVEASSALGATLAAIKNQSPLIQPLAMPSIETFRPPKFEHPMLETNSKLDKFLEGIDEIKPVITQTAGMLQSLNDAAIKMQNEFIVASTKAEEQAARATRLAVIGIFISAIGLIFSTYFSYRSMIDSQVSQATAKTDSENASKEAGEKVELLQKELQAIRAAVEQSSSKPVPQKQPRHSAAQ